MPVLHGLRISVPPKSPVIPKGHKNAILDEDDAPPASRTYKGMKSETGLTLLETLIAILILSFGLLAAGQLIYTSMASTSLARSKVAASVAAQDRLDSLADLYRRNPAASDLAAGTHGPQQVQVTNPVTGRSLNRFNVSWTVCAVPDPRPGKTLPARLVSVTVTPVGVDGTTQKTASLNKVVSVSSIFSAGVQ